MHNSLFIFERKTHLFFASPATHMIQNLRVTCCLSAIFILFCTSRLALATTLIWPDYPDGRLYRIDVQRKTLEAETQPNVWAMLGAVQMTDVSADAFPPVTRVTCLNTNNNRFRYLLVDCTQQVYRFDNQTRTLERLDKTFFRGYNCYSAKFLRQDTLYSFGGYGFWHTNNIQSYYKASNQEWESMNPSTNAPRAIYRGFNGYLPENNTFLSALSFYQNDSENKGAFTWNDSVSIYSFGQKTWKRVGLLTSTVKQRLQGDLVQKASWFQVGRYFILKYYESPQAIFLIVDPIRNETRIWKDTHKLLANLADSYEDDIQRSYVWNGAIYFRRNVTGATGNTIQSIRLSVDDLWKKSKTIGPFYEPTGTRNTFLYGLLVVALFVGGVIIFRLRKPTKLIAPAITHHSLPLDTPYPNSLSNLERDVFSVLLKTSDTNGLTTDQLNDILLIGDKSLDNQRKIRADVIKGLNLKLKLQWGIEEAVERVQTTLDRRMFTYAFKSDVKDRVQSIKTNHG